MRYKAIIFDVSDTIVEYKPNYAQIYSDRLRNLGFEVTDEKAKNISSIVNLAIGEQMYKELYGSIHLNEKELNELLDRKVLSYVIANDTHLEEYLKEMNKLSIPKQELFVINDVFPVLNYLKTKYRLGIVSNHHSWLMDYLEKSGLAPYFETIIISEIVGFSKPDIRIMQLALDALSLDAKSCLYVGDQPYDVLCSKQIGMDCAWITSEEYIREIINYHADYKISRLSELVKIL